uniref:Uncharacterized protein n=1 Tax=Tanacetum cinerariifolium TaxID=118510 RepID=A0A699H387_TANCI|nr:hypothetical protein [Tanacetum cinerariifolium]
MNPQDTQVAARDEKWVPFSERVKAFTIFADVPEIFMQQFWYSIKKVQGMDSYEFLLANKKCVVNADVFRTILDICPRVEGVNFTDVPDDDTTLAFLIKLCYKGLLYKHTNMFMDHMHQPWRTLAAIINKCLSRKTAGNDKLRRKRAQGEKTCHSPDSPRSSSITSSSNTSLSQTSIFNTIIQSKMMMFIKYSTDQIRPKNSKGNGSQRKKIDDDSQKTVDVSEESEPKPKPAKRKTGSRRVVKKKVTISAADNIIPDPDVALKLSKSISITEAEEEELAKQVHATYVRIVNESVYESAKKKTSRSSNSMLKGIPNLILEEQEEKEITEENVILEWGSKQESEHSEEDKLDEKEKGEKEGDVDDEDDETESDEDDIYNIVKDTTDANINSMLEVKIKSKVPHTSSPSMLSVPISSCFSDQFLKLFSDSSLVSIVKDTTDANINSMLEVKIKSKVLHTSSPSMLSISISKLEKDVSNLKKIDLSTKSLITLKIQFRSVVDNYFGSKVGDVFQKELKKHTTELIQKYSPQQILESFKKQTPTFDLEQGSEKNASEAALNEYDHKSAPYQTMHANKSFNKNPANHRLYYALMEGLIEDENAMDKGVVDIVQDHKRKHDDDDDDDNDDDDDDKHPPAGPNQGKQTKKRRTKEPESSKKPSSTKETQKGKALSKGPKTGKFATAKKPIEESIAEVIMDDTGDNVVHNDDQPQDTSEPMTAKTLNPKWFTQPPRPHIPGPEWNKCQVVLDQPQQPWFNQMVSTIKDPLTFNDLMATLIDFSKYVLNRLKIDNHTQDNLLGPAYNLLKGMCSCNIELEYHFQECFNALTDMLDWNNLKGDRYPFDLSKTLLLQGHPGHITVVADYFFNNDLEYLKSFDLKRTYTTLITKTKAARYEIKGIEYMVPTLWSPTKVGYDKDALKGIKHYGERRKLWHISQLNKFSKNNVYSTKKILRVKSVNVKTLYVYGHLEEIVVKRVDPLPMFTRSLVIKKRVEDLQLGVESYQKKLNITPPQPTVPEIEFKESYTPSHKPP